MTKAVLGIIGGSGMYELPGLVDVETVPVDSPWGAPSDALLRGRIGQTAIVFLSRHGKGHVHSPSDINYRANIDALKRLGVTDLISLTAVGSFREDLPPGSFVLVDQFVDRTCRRESSFFGKGCVGHVSLAHPLAPKLQARITRAALDEELMLRQGGTYVCIEGPQFSTRAESLTYKGLDYAVIGMTALTEAKLAREAEISHAAIAMVTDFDCWHPEHDEVTVAQVVAVMSANGLAARRLLARVAQDFPAEHEPCPLGSDRALDHAIMTAPSARDPALLAKLDAVAGRVLRTDQRD